MASLNEKANEIFSKREISEEDRKIDYKIGNTLSELEVLQNQDFNDENDKIMRKLVNRLNCFSKKKEYYGRVRMYIDDIKDCLWGVVQFYAENHKPIPKISIVYL